MPLFVCACFHSSLTCTREDVRCTYEERERVAKLKSTKRERGRERGTRNRTRRGRGMNGGESRIVVQTFHHPYEGSR